MATGSLSSALIRDAASDIGRAPAQGAAAAQSFFSAQKTAVGTSIQLANQADELENLKARTENQRQQVETQKFNRNLKFWDTISKQTSRKARSNIMKAWSNSRIKSGEPDLSATSKDMFIEADEDVLRRSNKIKAIFMRSGYSKEGADEITEAFIDDVGFGPAMEAAEAEMNRTSRENIAAQKTQQQQTAQISPKEINRGTEKLSAKLDKDDFQGLLTEITEINGLIDGGIFQAGVEEGQEKDIPSFGAGALLQFFPPAATKKGKDLRRSVAGLRNKLLKLRSGGAVTPDEGKRLAEELGEGLLKTDRDLLVGLRNVVNTLRGKMTNAEAGFDPLVVSTFADRGGITAAKFDSFLDVPIGGELSGGRRQQTAQTKTKTRDPVSRVVDAFKGIKGATPEAMEKKIQAATSLTETQKNEARTQLGLVQVAAQPQPAVTPAPLPGGQ